MNNTMEVKSLQDNNKSMLISAIRNAKDAYAQGFIIADERSELINDAAREYYGTAWAVTLRTLCPQELTTEELLEALDVKFITCKCCGKRMHTCRETIDYVYVGGGEYVCKECAKEHLMQCADCGQWYDPSELTTVANGDVVCNKCLDKNYERCTDCDELYRRDDMHELYNGDYVCSDCVEYGDYITCEECGRLVHIDDAERVRYRDSRDEWEYYCPECLKAMECNGDILTCDDCGEYVYSSWAHTDNYENVVCDYCYEWHDWYTCEQCGCLLRYDESYASEDGWLCEDCYNTYNNTNYIRSYHDGARSGLYLHAQGYEPTYNGRIRYFGLELEVDGGDDDDAIAEVFEALNGSSYMDEDTHAHFEHDGSLSDAGFEVITQPMTRAYLDEYRPKLEKATRILSRAGYRSHDARMCGLHIHVSRNTLSEQTINNMIYAISLFWHTCVRISRRTPEQLRSYATSYAYLDTDVPDDTPEKVLERAKEAKDSSRSRYFALNTTNRDTIELRICRGTLKVDTIYASIDFFEALISFAETHNEDDMLSMSTNDFINYLKNYSTGLAAYMETRGL